MRKIKTFGCFCLAFIFVMLWGFSVYAVEEVILFEKTYLRNTGEPSVVTDPFDIPNGAIRKAVIKVYNGEQAPNKDKRISSAVLKINDVTIFSQPQLNQNVGYLEKNINDLKEQNSLSVSLDSKPGGKIRVQIVQVTQKGIATGGPGDLAEVELSPDNVFSFKVIDGEFKDVTDTMQLQADTDYPELDGRLLSGSNAPFFFKFAKGAVGGFVYPTGVLISRLGNTSMPAVIEGEYNGFLFSVGLFFKLAYGGDLTAEPLIVPGFTIAPGGTSVTISKEGSSGQVYNLESTQFGQNILRAVNEENKTQFNLIFDGSGMLIDIPKGGYYQSDLGGFGTAIKAVPINLSTIPEVGEARRKFYSLVFPIDLPGIDVIYGFLTPVDNALSYEIYSVNPENRKYSDVYPEIQIPNKSGNFLFNQTSCGGVNLPNGGRGWGCDNSDYVNNPGSGTGYGVTIDPDQGIIAVIEFRGGRSNGIWIGGW